MVKKRLKKKYCAVSEAEIETLFSLRVQNGVINSPSFRKDSTENCIVTFGTFV